MKGLKKINIGLVLTIITIIAIVVYCISTENSRKGAKADIQKTCEEYINIVDKYSVLSEEYQKIGENSEEINLDNYKSNLEKELKNVMINDSAVDIQKKSFVRLIENQIVDTNKITTSYNREITKISSYKFEGNQVTVTFNAKVTVKQKYNEINQETGETSEKISENSYDTQGETITLEKKDGNWKIVYSDLQFSSESSNYYASSIM